MIGVSAFRLADRQRPGLFRPFQSGNCGIILFVVVSVSGIIVQIAHGVGAAEHGKMNVALIKFVGCSLWWD